MKARSFVDPLGLGAAGLVLKGSAGSLTGWSRPFSLAQAQTLAGSGRRRKKDHAEVFLENRTKLLQHFDRPIKSSI